MRRFTQTALMIIILFITSCTGQSIENIKLTEDVIVKTAEVAKEPLLPPVSDNTPTINREIHYGVARVPTHVDEMISELKGLSIGDFFDRSLIFWLSRDPESITILGLSDLLGTRNDQLTNISEVNILDTEKLENAILSTLRSYDRSSLTIEDQLNYDIYEWFWLDRVKGHKFRLYDYPVQSNSATSVPDRIVNLLVNYHPIKTEDDIEDYISRINQIDEKITQLINGLEVRESIGVRPPRAVLLDPINRYQSYLQRYGQQDFQLEKVILYANLKQKIDLIETIDENQKKNYLSRTSDAIEESFLPSYSQLIEYLRGLFERSIDDVGVWTYSSDSGYYQFLIQHYTSLNLTPEQIFAIGEINLQQETTKLRNLAQDILIETTSNKTENIADPINLEEIFKSIGSLPISKNNQAERNRIYSDSKLLIKDVFINTSSANSKMMDSNEVPPTWLASDPSIVFLIDPWVYGYYDPTTNFSNVPFLALSTLIYTEEFPGFKYYKMNSIQESDLPLFRSVFTFNGYFEGWMGYSANLMNKYGAFTDPTEGIYQIQRNVVLSASMVVDSGIHYRGWTIGESSNYMEDMAGMQRGSMRTTVERIVVTPGQVLSYQIGQYKFIELLEYAQKELGDYFSIKDYHSWLLSLGNMPLSVLEKQVQDYVIQQQKINQSNVVP